MKTFFCLTAAVLAGTAVGVAAEPPPAPTTGPRHSLTLVEAIDRAVEQNPTILKARAELKRAHGVVVETRAEAVPRLQAVGQYTENDVNFIDVFPGGSGPTENQERPWRASIEVSQLVYSGGRVNAALHAARLASEIAVLDYDRVLADTVLEVQQRFYEVLLNTELVTVRQESIHLLEQQLTDARHRFEVGAVPHFTVLRAEVELANAQPPLIRARNELRLSKENLVRLLALDDVVGQDNFTAMEFRGNLRYQPHDWQLTAALADAIENRPEFKQARQQVRLLQQNLRVARAGYLPELSVFAGYGIRNSLFQDDVDDTIDGWTAGARATWDIFDGMLTRGRVQQAQAELDQARIDAEDNRRTIELEVRQAFSAYQQALELIEAQTKTVEQATEGLRLAEARFRAGSGTQLDVLSAQTALTQARANEVQALHDYQVALATLERATGVTVRHAR